MGTLLQGGGCGGAVSGAGKGCGGVQRTGMDGGMEWKRGGSEAGSTSLGARSEAAEGEGAPLVLWAPLILVRAADRQDPLPLPEARLLDDPPPLAPRAQVEQRRSGPFSSWAALAEGWRPLQHTGNGR